MLKLRTFILMAIICLNAFPLLAQITSQEATDIVLNQVLSAELDQIDVFMLDEVKSGQFTIFLENNETVELPYSSNWVYFVDDRPFANWAHPCRYIFVDEATGAYQIVNEDFFPVDWKTAYTTVSEMPRPTPIDLPINPDAVIDGLDPNPNLYAVIINGADQDRYWNDISAIYCTLLDVYGYTKENIFIHYVNGTSVFGEDLDGDYIHDDFDYDAYKTTIHHTFQEMSGETNTSLEIPKLGPADGLFIFVDDHGYMSGGHSYVNLPGDDLSDFELAEYLEDINCAQIIAVLEPCQIGGFETELSDYINYNVSCKNRSVQTASNTESSWAEVWITGAKYDEFVYYWTAAARGYYPDDDFPWEESHAVGSFPFYDYPELVGHPGDHDPDLNGDGFVQMEEAFDYANDLDTWSEYGYYYPNISGYDPEDPQEFTDILFNEDLLSLCGIAGHVEATQTVENRNYLAGGNLIINPGISLTFENGGNLYLVNEIASLTVDPEATLTIRSEIKFSNSSYLQLKPGGKSIIDGGILTSLDNNHWQGIQVWGDKTAHQFPDANGNYQQGYLELKNGATIENAYNAVTLWKPDDWNSMGGIIQAENSSFINNRRSVEFMSYQNFHPYSGKPMDNLSYFTECKFDVNDEYSISDDFAYHITMWEVKGIKIRACEFSNSMTNTGKTGYGIYTMDAGYYVRSSCTTNVIPCPEPDIIHSTFTGLYAGIGALNSGSIYPFYVNDAVFDSNAYGIKLNASNYATLINNDIYVGDNTIDAVECAKNFGVGIDLTNCNGYAVEENKFYESTTMTGNSIGVKVNYEKEYINNVLEVQNNEIYKNQYDGLYVGNEAIGTNINFDNTDGLQFLCNINQNNTYDFYIKDVGIRLYQGTLDEAAGNEFSLNGNNLYSDYNNQAEWPILYFHNGNPPVDYSEKVFPEVAQNNNECLSHYGGGNNFQADGLGLTNTQKITYEQQYSDNLTSYNGTLALYESLKDGGNTETVVIDIETAWPYEMLELRADLLAKSPHLSKEVLYATANNTDVFPDAVIFEIMAANPDEMRDEEFLTFLAEKENPLPDYYIDILRGLASNISYKTILQSQMSGYKSKMSQAAGIIIRNILNDSICNMDTIRTWLGNFGSLASEYQIIDSYIQQDNTSDALVLLNLIPTLYDLSAEDTIEFNRYYNLKILQFTLINQSRNIFMLDSTEKSLIVEIAESSNGIAGMQARNILEFVYGEHYCDCPEIPDSVTYKNFTPSFYQQTNVLYKAEVDVFPNPANTWTAFKYHLPINNGDVYIQIFNAQGQNMHTLHLSGLEGQAVWDVRDVKPGVYHYVLKSAGGTKSGNLIILN